MFSEVMQQAGTSIIGFCGIRLTLPNMRNGRCFPTSFALSNATFDRIKAHMYFTRNAVGVPCFGNGQINRSQHDAEIDLAKKSAQRIIERLERLPDSGACIQRLRDGHVTEEEDLMMIASAMDVGFQLYTSDDLYKPFMKVNEEAPKDLDLVLSGKSHLEAHHWDPIILAPRAALLGACRAILQLKSQVPITNDRKILVLQTELDKVRKRCSRLSKRARKLQNGQADSVDRIVVLELSCHRHPQTSVENRAPATPGSVRPPLKSTSMDIPGHVAD